MAFPLMAVLSAFSALKGSQGQDQGLSGQVEMEDEQMQPQTLLEMMRKRQMMKEMNGMNGMDNMGGYPNA